MEKVLKVGVLKGGGPPPGYVWNVCILDVSFEEAMSFLKEHQYQHLAMQVKELATHKVPTISAVIDIDKVEDFFEIRDKGGPLGMINVRVFFMVDEKEQTIVILGVWHKQNNGPTPKHIKIRIQRRMRVYHENKATWK